MRKNIHLFVLKLQVQFVSASAYMFIWHSAYVLVIPLTDTWQDFWKYKTALKICWEWQTPKKTEGTKTWNKENKELK